MIDERLQVNFSKKDITGEEELPGASLKVTDLEGNVIDEWVSDTESHIVNLKAGKYVLTETAPPERYATAESVEFVSRPDLSVTKVEMRDAPIQVEVSKKDIATGDELPGARLQVLDTDGRVVEEWTSTDKPHMLSLSPGTYTLIEDLAPIGYATASAISFEVKDTAEIQKVEMFDDVTKVVCIQPWSYFRSGNCLPFRPSGQMRNVAERGVDIMVVQRSASGYLFSARSAGSYPYVLESP